MPGVIEITIAGIILVKMGWEGLSPRENKKRPKKEESQQGYRETLRKFSNDTPLNPIT